MKTQQMMADNKRTTEEIQRVNHTIACHQEEQSAKIKEARVKSNCLYKFNRILEKQNKILLTKISRLLRVCTGRAVSK